MLKFTIFLDRLFIILVHAFGNCIWELNDEKVISLKRRLYIFSFLYLLLSHFIVFFIVCIFFAKYKHPIPLFNKYSRGTCTYTRSMILIMILKKYSWIRHTWFRRMRFSWYKHSVPTVFLSLQCILFRYIRFRHICLSAVF